MIDVAHQHPSRRFSVKETLRVVGFVLQRVSAKRWQVSVVFTNDRFMRQMNRRFLDHDTVTDVIAFPLMDRMDVDAEVYVNLDQARRQAAEYGVTVAEEVKRLLIHGTLHLLGYRDSTKAQRQRMARKEDRLFNQLAKR
jgi:rRNA maturation RNase YbeY